MASELAPGATQVISAVPASLNDFSTGCFSQEA